MKSMDHKRELIAQVLLHYSECFSNNKDFCDDHNVLCEEMRKDNDHIFEHLNDMEHYKQCELCQLYNQEIQKHHEDDCTLNKCVFRTISRFYIFARHYLNCNKKTDKKCKFCRDNHTLYKIMETCTQHPEEATNGIYERAFIAIEHVKQCNRPDCWVCHIPYLEKKGYIDEFEPKKTKSMKYKKLIANLNKSKVNNPNESLTSLNADTLNASSTHPLAASNNNIPRMNGSIPPCSPYTTMAPPPPPPYYRMRQPYRSIDRPIDRSYIEDPRYNYDAYEDYNRSRLPLPPTTSPSYPYSHTPNNRTLPLESSLYSSNSMSNEYEYSNAFHYTKRPLNSYDMQFTEEYMDESYEYIDPYQARDLYYPKKQINRALYKDNNKASWNNSFVPSMEYSRNPYEWTSYNNNSSSFNDPYSTNMPMDSRGDVMEYTPNSRFSRYTHEIPTHDYAYTNQPNNNYLMDSGSINQDQFFDMLPKENTFTPRFK
ncbi:hypothetical protein WA158_007366 [Blastocystis sp. Blastoise]